ncbi:uncharacterized protein LOC111710403 [Eurytemora carolleeae]|uniref:uncharacterized protein LOC111710403 n=1 Tax=Eurytemora carolleeae TaxID=1294199 RepID=UPI000C77E8DB|nr:uncharacterized protein LOC111710403 [Eurytemora carolleeae]|eukprot:XP_023340251.1 uncharacterized protein LOC111710403 [Eurytemora affinis]
MVPLDLQSVQRLTRDMSDLEVREQLDSRELDQLLQELENTDSETQLECLRGLRMSVAGVRKNAQYVLDKLSSDTKLQDLVCLFFSGTGLSLRIYLQMLANCINQEVIIQECLKESILEISSSIYSNSKDEKSSNVLSSILLSLMKKEENLEKYLQFIDPWIHLISGEEVEFSALCIKHIVLKHRLVELESLKRQALLPILIDLEILPELDIDSVSSIVQDFTFLTDKILTTNIGSVEDLEPEIIMNLLEIIQSAAAITIHQSRLQGMQSLLLNTLYLLRMVHEAGKNGVEDFKPIGKLSELSELQKKTPGSEDDLESNPVFGFKETG